MFVPVHTFYVIQSGLVLRSFEGTWQNKNSDDQIAELWDTGREYEILEPGHFQGVYALMGCMIAVALGKSVT